MCSTCSDGPLQPPGFPIRKSPGQSLFAATRGLSQLTTSFIAWCRQGIHLLLFFILSDPLKLRRLASRFRGCRVSDVDGIPANLRLNFQRTFSLNGKKVSYCCFLFWSWTAVVGPGGLEPPTPALSRRCSNQLSYGPPALIGK